MRCGRRPSRIRATEHPGSGSHRTHPVPESATIGAAQHPSVAEGERDATQDYLESDSEAFVVRLRDGAARGAPAADPGGTGASPRRGPCAVRPVPPPGPGLRHPGAAALRLRAPLAHPGRLRLRDAPRVVPALRRPCRGRPLGHRQAPGDGRPRLVPRRVGQATVVARGRRGVPDLLGHRPSSRPHGGRLGAGAPRPLVGRSDRRGRARAPARAPIPDVGLPDRPPPSASAVGRARTQGGDAAGLLRLVRRGAQ